MTDSTPTALDQADQTERAEVLARRQRALADLGPRALVEPDLDRLFQRATEVVSAELGVEFVKVLELLPGGEELRLRAGVGWREGLVGIGTVGAGLESQAGFTLRSDAPVVVRDLRSESRFSGPQLLHDHGVVSGASVVIGGRDRPFGVLGAHTQRCRVFTDDDVDFMLAVASMLAYAVADFRRAENERLKLDFLRLASHELRGPVAVARGYLSMVEDRSIDPASAQYWDVVQVVSEKLGEMDYLIDQMLEAGRSQGRDAVLRLEAFDLREVAVQVVRAASIQTQRHRVEAELDAAPAPVRGDRIRIANVISHLIDNAIKYSPGGGRVDCRVWSTPAQCFVAVEDRGLGIAPDDLPHLFRHFSRLQTAETESIPGTGLGLVLSRQVAREHGGDITVDSAPGEGSRFTLALPIAPSSA